jgi:hypothetical protein
MQYYRLSHNIDRDFQKTLSIQDLILDNRFYALGEAIEIVEQRICFSNFSLFESENK